MKEGSKLTEKGSRLDEPTSSRAAVLAYFNSDEGLPAGCVPVRVPTGEFKDLSAQDRLDLRRCLDELRA